MARDLPFADESDLDDIFGFGHVPASAPGGSGATDGLALPGDPTAALPGEAEASGVPQAYDFGEDDTPALDASLPAADAATPAPDGIEAADRAVLTDSSRLDALLAREAAEIEDYVLATTYHSGDSGAGGGFETCGCPMCGGSQGEIGGLSGDGTDDAPGAPGSINTLANYLNTGFWTDTGRTSRWFNMTNSGTGANSETLYYDLNGWSGTRNGYSDSNGVGTTTHRTMIRDAFDFYGELLGINFVEWTGADSTVVDFFFGDFDSGRAFNSANVYSGTGGAIDYNVINVAAGWGNGLGGTYNGYVYQTFLHEIGHGMGLGHQGNYNAGSGSPTYGTSAQWENDSWALSIMSYWSQTTNTSSSTPYDYAELISLATADFEALDELYSSMGNGVSNAFNGNTVYGVGTTITSAVNYQMSLLASFADTNAFTIVDGSGIDTVDFSNFAVDQVLDLRVVSDGETLGSVSSIGGLDGNMNLAVGTVIENGTLGAGNDLIYGSSSAINTLTGNAGNDTLYGFGMSDTLYGGDGNDYLYGGDDNDRAFGGDGIDRFYSGGNTTGFDYFFAGGADGDIDYAYGGVGNDAFYAGSTGSGTGVFYGYGGNVTNSGNDYFYGGGDVDRFYGYDDDDRLYGRSGNDTLVGGTGNDTLDGGAGNDRIYAGNTSDDTDSSDNIVYGGTGDDIIWMRLAGNTIDGGDGVDTLILQYSGTIDGDRRIDIDQGYSFAGGAFQGTWSGLENVTSAVNMQVHLIGNSLANVLRASSRDDTITAENGNDALYGNDGNDTLYGGGGVDTLYGGNGDDILQGGVTTDDVYGGAGNDIIQALDGEFYDNSYGGSGIDTLDHSDSDYDGEIFDFENDTITGSHINGGTATVQSIEIYQDGSGDNTIISAGTGQTLYGNAGNDTMIATSGAETMYGGAGVDTVDLSVGNFIYVFNMMTGSTNYSELHQGFEIAIMGNAGDTITAGFGTNTIYGGGGNDTVMMSDFGIDGDEFYGGDGDDTFDVSSPSWGTRVDIDLNAGTWSYFGGSEVVSGFENVNGSSQLGSVIEYLGGTGGANTIWGNGGDDIISARTGNDELYGGDGNDLINGGGGIDTMDGGAGDDIFIVNNASDVVIEDAGEGTDLIRANTSIDLANFANVENVELLGSGNLNILGSADANVLTGNDGQNVIDGLGGDDSIYGGRGIDTLYGGTGNDFINGAGAADEMYGGSGNDRFVFNDAGDRAFDSSGIDEVFITVSTVMNVMAADVENLTMLGSTNMSASGTGADNVMTGNDGDNTINGGGGNDTIYGGAGNDVLNGGAGNDLLVGNGGVDDFVFENGWGQDIIQGFSTAAGNEDIDLSAVSAIVDFADLVANHLTEIGGNATIFAGINSITLLGVLAADLDASDFIF